MKNWFHPKLEEKKIYNLSDLVHPGWCTNESLFGIAKNIEFKCNRNWLKLKFAQYPIKEGKLNWREKKTNYNLYDNVMYAISISGMTKSWVLHTHSLNHSHTHFKSSK